MLYYAGDSMVGSAVEDDKSTQVPYWWFAQFALAIPAGIMQADVGLNRILHNTQWIIGPHVHVAILVGLTMTLYSGGLLLAPNSHEWRRTLESKVGQSSFLASSLVESAWVVSWVW